MKKLKLEGDAKMLAHPRLVYEVERRRLTGLGDGG
jgi:hypothetical protein